MNETTERTSRSSSETKSVRNKPWTPPSSLDAPPAPKGFVHRWIRTEFMGQEDTGNVSKKLSYLIIGDKPTKRKILHAKELKVKILSQKELLQKLNKRS